MFPYLAILIASIRWNAVTAFVANPASKNLDSSTWFSSTSKYHATRKSASNPIKSTTKLLADASDLTSALATLDKQWQIQQTAKPGRSRWTKLALPTDSSTTNSDDPVVEVPPETSLTDDFVYLLEPPNNSRPSCLIVFTGGAGLGSYPQIAYNEFLLNCSNRLNAAVITAPYNVGLDHFSLAKETGELTRRAIIHCQDDSSRQYPSNLPVYSLSHSLGSKLSCIYAAATEQAYDGIGYISFNNFSFGKTIGMAKEFAETIRQNTGLGKSAAAGVTDEALNGLFNFAEMAVSATGIDFTPSQDQMNGLIAKKFTTEQQSKTRLFSFDDDRLENSPDFVDACNHGDASTGSISISALPGTHLTPVFFKLGLEEMELPEDVQQMAADSMGGLQSASFGNAEELESLVTEVCDWILGRGPSRVPDWWRERPQLVAETAVTE